MYDVNVVLVLVSAFSFHYNIQEYLDHIVNYDFRGECIKNYLIGLYTDKHATA